MKDINWFKEIIAPQLGGYDIEYKSFTQEGDFGFLTQVDFDSKLLTGSIEFWDSGWLGIGVWDLMNDKFLMNTMMEPNEEENKDKAFQELLQYLI